MAIEPSPDILSDLYGQRFTEADRRAKDVLWSILCRDFFQRWVPRDARLLDVGAGLCEFVNHIQAAERWALDMAWFDHNPVGKVVSRVTTDVDVLSEMFAAGAMTVVLDALKLVGIVAVMLWIDWRLAVASLVLLPPMVFAIDFFRRMARRTYREIRERIARINGYLQESISGMSVIALSAREERCFAEFTALNADHRDANQLSNRFEAALFSLVDSVSTVSVAAMLWRAAGLRGDALEVGTVWAFIQYINQFFVPIRDFSAKYAVMGQGKRKYSDHVAVEAMRKSMDPLPM